MPPDKGDHENLGSFYGAFDWPYLSYQRYNMCADLEQTADQSHSMTAAFSTLSCVTELAISMDSGLGWICGPDRSDRAKLFKGKMKVFGSSHTLLDSQARERINLWRDIVDHHRLQLALHDSNLRRTNQSAGGFRDSVVSSLRAINLGLKHFQQSVRKAIGSRILRYGDLTEEEIVDGQEDDEDSFWPLVFEGENIDLDVGDSIVVPLPGDPSPFEQYPLLPNSLTSKQKEWLLETAWAQQAFVASYTLAIIDNKETFRNVRTLNITALPSRYITAFRRHDFWAALPAVSALGIQIISEWRDIIMKNSNYVEAPAVKPSTAVTALSALLRDFIAPLISIESLSLGWLGGGEHATGLFARNKNILAAPLSLKRNDISEVSEECDLIELPHVKHLKLTNCWISPSMLENFVKIHETTLRTLDLDSVSLTLSGIEAQMAQPPAFQAGIVAAAAPAIQAALNVHPPPPVSEERLDFLSRTHRRGSWPDIIERIMRGTTRAETRSTRDGSELPVQEFHRSLERIDFNSCGYAVLPDVNPIDHAARRILNQVDAMTMRLRKREYYLMPLMTLKNDPMLGQILPRMADDELDTLQQAWNMRHGWGSDSKKYHNLEDGQPLGGTGRFSGSVQTK